MLGDLTSTPTRSVLMLEALHDPRSVFRVECDVGTLFSWYAHEHPLRCREESTAACERCSCLQRSQTGSHRLASGLVLQCRAALFQRGPYIPRPQPRLS